MASINLICPICNKEFTLPLSVYKTRIKSNTSDKYIPVCSNDCKYIAQIYKKQVVCLNCGIEFYKRRSQIRKNPNHFCCRSCTATYYNKRKTFGSSRSKLERHLEEQIEMYYPELKCSYNNKQIIGSELDFYFPTLKLAIELNGIFHYEPIYGQEKFERLQNNDKQKGIRCQELNIEFCVIDSSTCNNLTQIQKDKYWSILESIINQIYKRHLDNNQ